jgi:hypothetical protein
VLKRAENLGYPPGKSSTAIITLADDVIEWLEKENHAKYRKLTLDSIGLVHSGVTASGHLGREIYFLEA